MSGVVVCMLIEEGEVKVAEEEGARTGECGLGEPVVERFVLEGVGEWCWLLTEENRCCNFAPKRLRERIERFLCRMSGRGLSA